MALSESKWLLAPAKINLRLEVHEKRVDGYHEIRSIMVKVGLYDVLSLCPTPEGVKMTTNNKQIPLDHGNLAFKAASLLMRDANVPGGLHIHLEKNIPIAAGLGGGSSDAATTMKGINQQYGLNYSPAELMKLGAKIGADVPFFFSPGPAFASGIGERLSPIKLTPSFWILFVTPSISVSTAWAYSQIHTQPKKSTLNFLEKIDLLKFGKEILYNDLESVVIPHFPEIGMIKQIVEGFGAWGSLMSGSGPTVFGIFFEEREAKRAEKNLAKNYGDRNWNVFVAQALL